MSTERSIVILEGARRTPRADIVSSAGGPGLFSRFSTTQLGGLAIRATLAQTALEPRLIGHVVMGMAAQSHRDSIYGAQGMRWRGGLDESVPALTVSRICGSGVEALAVGAELILAGLRHDPERPFVVVGGAESMQLPFCLYGPRGHLPDGTPHKYGPIEVRRLPAESYLQDAFLLGLWDPSARRSMAETAEELGRRYGVSRAEADEFAYRSQQRAKAARDRGCFSEEIVPLEVMIDGGQPPLVVRHDTHILEEALLEKMALLAPAFARDGVITAANASAVVDGAAAMVIGKESDARALGLRPLARLASVAVAGCPPEIMGWGPVPATRLALARAGLSGADLDHVELNEAFAPQALACIQDFARMGIDPARVNPLGGAIALGHPLGATGAMLTLTCACALRRQRQRYGLVTMCIGGGQGIALVLESVGP